MPKKILNTRICKIFPPVSDSNTLVGIMPMKVSITPGRSPCSLVTSIRSVILWAVKSTPLPGWNRFPSTNAKVTAIPEVTIKKPNVPRPIFPAEGVSPRLAAPEMIATNTSGMTNILIKWIKIVPNGANMLASSPNHQPTAAPKNMAITTCTPILPIQCLLFIVMSPPHKGVILSKSKRAKVPHSSQSLPWVFSTQAQQLVKNGKRCKENLKYSILFAF